MMERYRVTSAGMVALLAAGAIGCSVSVEPGFGGACIDSLATAALANPATPTIAANIADQIGLVPRARADAPPVPTKQVEFGTPDGVMHYFAIAGPDWTRAALMRVPTASGSPLIRFYVIDREGNLIQATEAQSPRVTPLSIEEQTVREAYDVERELWREVGSDDVCGRP